MWSNKSEQIQSDWEINSNKKHDNTVGKMGGGGEIEKESELEFVAVQSALTRENAHTKDGTIWVCMWDKKRLK